MPAVCLLYIWLTMVLLLMQNPHGGHDSVQEDPQIQ